MDYSTRLCGISHDFSRLFPTGGQVTYVLRTRSPLAPRGACDLHVLSMPPMFILSQDQTLHESLTTPKGNGVHSLRRFAVFWLRFYHSSVGKVHPAQSR